jgi:hypothetical protein
LQENKDEEWDAEGLLQKNQDQRETDAQGREEDVQEMIFAHQFK